MWFKVDIIKALSESIREYRQIGGPICEGGPAERLCDGCVVERSCSYRTTDLDDTEGIAQPEQTTQHNLQEESQYPDQCPRGDHG